VLDGGREMLRDVATATNCRTKTAINWPMRTIAIGNWLWRGFGCSADRMQILPDTLHLREVAMATIFLVFGRPFVKRFALCYQSVVCLSCLSCVFLCPVLSVILVYGGQAVRWIKTKLGVQVSLRAGHIVLDGYQLPFCKRDRAPAPIFGPYPLWPNGWMEQGATW